MNRVTVSGGVGGGTDSGLIGNLYYYTSSMYNSYQCPKLRVHPAPDAHISTAGCTIFGAVHPVCTRFLNYLLLLCIGRVHGSISGCTVLGEVHPVSAQNKSLISDTGYVQPAVAVLLQGRTSLEKRGRVVFSG